MSRAELSERRRRVVMSERAPLLIRESDWPVLCESAGNLEAEGDVAILVRQHADGRRLVYGYSDSDSGGWLLAGGEWAETVRAVRRVGGILRRPDLAARCIEQLPSEVLT